MLKQDVTIPVPYGSRSVDSSSSIFFVARIWCFIKHLRSYYSPRWMPWCYPSCNFPITMLVIWVTYEYSLSFTIPTSSSILPDSMFFSFLHHFYPSSPAACASKGPCKFAWRSSLSLVWFCPVGLRCTIPTSDWYGNILALSPVTTPGQDAEDKKQWSG